MESTFVRGERAALVSNILVTVGIAAVANGVLAAFGWMRPATEVWPAFAPPGHTIGAIWVVLFAGMGVARWSISRVPASTDRVDRVGIDALIALCLAYPFYTHFISGHAIELAGNIAAFAVAAWLAIRLRSNRLAATLVAAVAVWVAFATVLVVALVRLNGWA